MKDKTYREDELDAILEMTHGGCQITVPTIKGSCHKSAKQAIQEHIEGKVLEELEKLEKVRDEHKFSTYPGQYLTDRIKELKDKGGSK